MRRGALRIGVVAVLAVASVEVIRVSPAASPQRIAATFLLILVLPGLGMRDLLSQGRGPDFLLVPAYGIAITILDSAALSLAHVALTGAAWSWSLAVIAFLAEVGATMRRAPLSPLRWPSRAPVSVLLGAGVAIVLLTGAAVVTAESVRHTQSSDHFTQLWAVPERETNSAVDVGIYNHEGSARQYVLDIRSGGRLLDQTSATVPAGGVWQRRFRPPPTSSRMTFTASAPGSPAVHQWVALARTSVGLASGQAVLVVCGGRKLYVPRWRLPTSGVRPNSRTVSVVGQGGAAHICQSGLPAAHGRKSTRPTSGRRGT